jgi:hypothetical protein
MKCCKHEAQGSLIITLHQLAKAWQKNADARTLTRLRTRVEREKKNLGEEWSTMARRLYASGQVISLRCGIEFLVCRTGELFILQLPTIKWFALKTPTGDELTIVRDINIAVSELVCAHFSFGIDVLDPKYQLGIDQALSDCHSFVHNPKANPQDFLPLASFDNMFLIAQQAVKKPSNPNFCPPFVHSCIIFQQAWKTHGSPLNTTEQYRNGLSLAIQTVAECYLVQ